MRCCVRWRKLEGNSEELRRVSGKHILFLGLAVIEMVVPFGFVWHKFRLVLFDKGRKASVIKSTKRAEFHGLC